MRELGVINMRKLLAGAAFGAAMALAGQASAGVNIVSNPNMDLDSPSYATAPIDWTLTPAASGSDFFVGMGPTFGAYSPPNSANFGAVSSDEDELSQVLATVVGQTYTISFELAHPTTYADNAFSVWFGGDEGFSLVNAASFSYTSETFTATATSSSTTIAFYGRDQPGYYELDNVSVSVIPEASTWAMMLVGFAGLGFVSLRARRTAIAAV
jgi:hypothetical protein